MRQSVQLVEKVFFDKLSDFEKHTQTLRLPLRSISKRTKMNVRAFVRGFN